MVDSWNEVSWAEVSLSDHKEAIQYLICLLVCVCRYSQIYFYSWQYTECFLYRCFNYGSLGWILFLSFFSPTLFPSLSLSSHLYLNTNGGLLKRNCPQNAGVPVVFHTQRACRTSRTRVESVPRIIGACASFPRLQVIIGLSGLHVAWCSTGSERCLWQQKRIQILKAALEGLAHSTCWVVILTCNIYFRYTDLFPCCWVALICILYRCLRTLNPNLLFSFVAFLWGI